MGFRFAPKETMTSFHPFAEQGNFTTVHNIVIDKIMPQLTGAEFKILIAIIRLTVGWHKERDAISYSQFGKVTGLGSTATIRKALSGLESNGLITVVKTEKWNSPFIYSLNRAFSIPLESEVMEENVSENEIMEEGTSKSEVLEAEGVAKSEVLPNKETKRNKTKTPLTPQIPEKLDTPQFNQTWDDWCVFRKEVGAKLTPTTVSRQFSKLKKHSPSIATAMLEQSMTNGWRGIFDVKASYNGSKLQSVKRAGEYTAEGRI